MKLFTQINISDPENKYAYSTKIAGIGSCFAQYIMEHFKLLGFDTSYNPNGIVYNIVSIARSLEHISQNTLYSEKDFIQHNNLWHSWEHHGSFSSKNIDQLKLNIQNSLNDFRDRLNTADLFILTPSSSVVYCLKDTGRIVANCHKYPGNNFYTRILSKEDNFYALLNSIKCIRKVNPDCLIVITLSPVRHYPGNLVLNARSKANLLSAIHECMENDENITYFPSYEILLDELRDYRFYSDDMLHPGTLARKIIFDRFIDSFFDTDCRKKIIEAEKIYKSNQHKNMNKYE